MKSLLLFSSSSLLAIAVINLCIAPGLSDPIPSIPQIQPQIIEPDTDLEYLKHARIEELEGLALANYLERMTEFLRVEDLPDMDKIVGGEDALPGEAPFQAQVFRKSLYRTSFMCGGSLISTRTVLTAGHCFNFFINYRIRYGSNSRMSSPFPESELQAIRVHKGFNLTTVQNDIALFILKSPVTPGANVRAIDLEQRPLPANTSMTLFGFGLTNGIGNVPAQKLQKAELQIIDEEACREFIEALGVEKHPGMLCASAPNRSACNGDSGGPLVVTESGLQAGVVSFGTRFCPPGSINVYTNVSHYQEWIAQNMEK